MKTEMYKPHDRTPCAWEDYLGRRVLLRLKSDFTVVDEAVVWELSPSKQYVMLMFRANDSWASIDAWDVIECFPEEPMQTSTLSNAVSVVDSISVISEDQRVKLLTISDSFTSAE